MPWDGLKLDWLGALVGQASHSPQHGHWSELAGGRKQTGLRDAHRNHRQPLNCDLDDRRPLRPPLQARPPSSPPAGMPSAAKAKKAAAKKSGRKAGDAPELAPVQPATAATAAAGGRPDPQIQADVQVRGLVVL